MADIDFPTFARTARDGMFSESAMETKVRDKSDVGAPRSRNRFTRALGQFAFQLLLTDAEKEQLLAFYDVTLVRGVEQCNWTHPRTLVVYEVSMVTRPKAVHLTGDLWTADLEIEEV
jgi:hypothetical protein